MTTDTPAPTIKEVAAYAGVALSSVSRVLNKHPDVSTAMRSRVLESVEALGYEPNLLAAGLRSGSTRTIGFIVSDISNPLFAEITLGASRRLEEAGYTMVLTNSEGDPQRDGEMIRLLRWRQVDGFIVSVADESRKSTIEELKRVDTPVVLLDREIPELNMAAAVLTDHRSGMNDATEHLVGLGHRRIALISGPLVTRPGRERLEGFRAVFRAHDIAQPEYLIRSGPMNAEFGEAMTHEVLDDPNPPTAILCGGNLTLIGVLRALKSRSLSVGSDVALISCDDVPLAELHVPPVSVIARDTVALGELAAEVMLQRMTAEVQTAQVEIVPTHLILRSSTFKAS
ncbi:MAG: LacI family DNA-binding transcriptional regulator [Acidobacteria bacterium]|nr:LacI family DNA-binding transcriptional regulator [Acidobacteriota bacterium]